MLTVHHLGRSQSERIVWLCEELGLEYELKRYERAPLLAPPEYKALHPIGTAPVITDGDLVLGESGAIIEYILAKYGGGRLQRAVGHREFANYLYWLHFANGSFQALLHRTLIARRLEPSAEHPVLVNADAPRGRARIHESPPRRGGLPRGR
jgi:glutathione S-transferase